ncbi:conserved Plasmodium protein, unknown function [Plasmodium malariae]|nr:conserved Plasmodium protein, unknown function [Plasmodium malariae]
MNIGKIYTSQNVLKYCYKCIKYSYFVNIDINYIKDKYKEIKNKYYTNEDYLKNMFDYVKKNYDYIKKIKCPFNTFFVGELNLDNLLNLSILDLLECAFKVFFISYINSVMSSKLIYLKKMQNVLSKMFNIIKNIHKKKKKERKKKKENLFLKSLIDKSKAEEQLTNRDKNFHHHDQHDYHRATFLRMNIMTYKDSSGSKCTKEDRISGAPNENEEESTVIQKKVNNEGGGFCTVKVNVERETDGRNDGYNNGNINGNNNIIGNYIKTEEQVQKIRDNANDSEKNSSDNNVDTNYKEQNLNYKNGFNINKEENYFKNYCICPEKKKRNMPPYSDTNFSREIRRTYKKRYKIIFNKKLFHLFEKCEELFNKGMWLFQIFNSNLNEKRIFKIINTILESEEKEILIKPKYEKYFYNFIKNMCLNENNKNNIFDKKLNNSNSKFQKINRTISSRNLPKTIKTKNTKIPMTNNSPSYQNFGVSVKIKKNESLTSQTSDQNNMLNKDKLSLLLHSNNKEQNIQECIMDYVDYSFNDPFYSNPARMYCSISPIDTTVSFIKTSPIL